MTHLEWWNYYVWRWMGFRVAWSAQEEMKDNFHRDIVVRIGIMWGVWPSSGWGNTPWQGFFGEPRFLQMLVLRIPIRVELIPEEPQPEEEGKSDG